MLALALLLTAPFVVAAGPLQKRIGGSATYYNVETGNACVASFGRPPLLPVLVNHRFSSIVAPAVHTSATVTLYVPPMGCEAHLLILRASRLLL